MSLPVKDNREQTEDVKGTVQFSEMNLQEQLVNSLRRINFITATPIQEQAIPAIISGIDVVARAKNGTGKSGAFAIPILNQLDPSSGQIQALILAHTKELAMQLSLNIKEMSRQMGGVSDKVMCVVGGQEINDDRQRFELSPLIVVGTPGKVKSYLQKKLINPRNIRTLVIDEADELITSQSFMEDLGDIMKFLPRNAQKLLFSATFPASVEQFCLKNMHDPEFINCMEQTLTLQGVSQYIACLREDRFKVKLLNQLFTKLAMNQCIVFVNKSAKCEPLCYQIQQDLQIPCLFVHAGMDLEKRSQIFHDFSHQKARVLVTTDLYTRGIDIRTVNVVINFEVPLSSDMYLHRIGRCGRFGHRGLAITLMAGDFEKNRFLKIDSEIKGGMMIKLLPADLSEIDTSLYACSREDVQMK